MRAFAVIMPSGVRYWTVLDEDLAVVAVADHGQALGPPGRARLGRRGGPRQGGRGRDPGEAVVLAVADEVGEHAALLPQRVADRAAQRQVVLGGPA